MSSVYEGTPPPPDLRLAWMCGDSILPDSGGVLDQDYQTMHRMRSAENIHRVLSKLKNAQGAEIHRLNDGERRLIRALRDGEFI